MCGFSFTGFGIAIMRYPSRYRAERSISSEYTRSDTFGISPAGSLLPRPEISSSASVSSIWISEPTVPFKFKVKDERLLISGCWSEFETIQGHRGFAEIASLLDLDEKGPASSVAVEGLEAQKVWEVGERVSRAINS